MSSHSLPSAVLLAAGVLVLGGVAGAGAATVITGADIKDGTVTSVDVKNGSLAAGDLAPAVVKKFSVIQGYETLQRQVTVPAGNEGQVTVSCSAGKHVLGGGSYWQEIDDGTQFVLSNSTSGAVAYAINSTGIELRLTIRIVCAPVVGDTDFLERAPARGSKGR